jgi:hypothetical protein
MSKSVDKGADTEVYEDAQACFHKGQLGFVILKEAAAPSSSRRTDSSHRVVVFRQVTDSRKVARDGQPARLSPIKTFFLSLFGISRFLEALPFGIIQWLCSPRLYPCFRFEKNAFDVLRWGRWKEGLYA